MNKFKEKELEGDTVKVKNTLGIGIGVLDWGGDKEPTQNNKTQYKRNVG